MQNSELKLAQLMTTVPPSTCSRHPNSFATILAGYTLIAKFYKKIIIILPKTKQNDLHVAFRQNDMH